MSVDWISPVIEYYKIFFGDDADIIIDVGTRDGDDAYLIKQKLNSIHVYAIDARKEATEETKAKYPEFNVFETAVSNYEGTTKFYSVISDDKDYSGSSSIYNKKFRRKEYKHEIIEVPVITMNTFIEMNNLEYKYLDIVKVDIEGYTYQFLEGFTKHMNNVKLFHLETEINSTHKNHRNNEEVAELLRKNSFVLVAKQYEWGSEIEDQIWVNKYLINNEKERKKWLKYS